MRKSPGGGISHLSRVIPGRRHFTEQWTSGMAQPVEAEEDAKDNLGRGKTLVKHTLTLEIDQSRAARAPNLHRNTRPARTGARHPCAKCSPTSRAHQLSSLTACYRPSIPLLRAIPWCLDGGHAMKNQRAVAMNDADFGHPRRQRVSTIARSCRSRESRPHPL